MIIIDNPKYGIYSDGTHPAETTAGINLALADYAAAGQTTVGLAPGSYLIAADAPITIPQWTTLSYTLNPPQNYPIHPPPSVVPPAAAQAAPAAFWSTVQ